MADKGSYSSTAQLNKPISIQKTPTIHWSTSDVQSAGFVIRFPLREPRLLFELKVLATFLKEILAHPITTSRVSVDGQRRIVVIKRD